MALLQEDGGEMKRGRRESWQGRGGNGDTHLKGVRGAVANCC